WGVRGSVPAPLTGAKVQAKVAQALSIAMRQGLPADEASIAAWMQEQLPFIARSTFGGNTSCVEVRCGEQLFINDMGTGLRELGVALLPEMFRSKGIQGHILCSHVHWDHIQGFPFWAQLYFPRTQFDNRFTFHGGLAWKKSLEEVLRGQMNEPVFPVDFEE